MKMMKLQKWEFRFIQMLAVNLMLSVISTGGYAQSPGSPYLTFDSPVGEHLEITCDNFVAVPLRGTCSEVGRPIQITASRGGSNPPVLGTTTCRSNGTWSISPSFSSVPGGTGVVTMTHTDLRGESAVVFKTYSKSGDETTMIELSTVDLLYNNRLRYVSSNACIALTRDLSIPAWEGWTWPFTFHGTFQGQFDGRGFKINGLRNVFFAETNGAVIKNVTFEGARLRRGIVELGRRTTFYNVHVQGVLEPSTSNPTNALLGRGAGALAYQLYDGGSIVDSSATIEVASYGQWNTQSQGTLGGLVAHWTGWPFGSTGYSQEFRVVNSRATVVAKLDSGIRLAGLGGLIGGSSTCGEIVDSHSSVEVAKLRTGWDSRGSMTVFGGLIAGANGDCANRPLQILRSSARVAVDYNVSTSGQEYAPSVGALMLVSDGSSNAIKVNIEDSMAQGHIELNEIPRRYPSRFTVSGFLGIIPVTSSGRPSFSISVNHSLANVSIEGSNLSPGVRPFISAYGIGDRGNLLKPQVEASFYNSDLIQGDIMKDGFASGLTQADMESASFWLDAGFSSEVWELQDGQVPQLKGAIK